MAPHTHVIVGGEPFDIGAEAIRLCSVSDTDEKTRLLICHSCSSIDPLPWFDGPADYDDTLNFRVAQHRDVNGTPHIGILAVVKTEDWNKQPYQDAIRDKIAEEAGISLPGQSAGLGETYYEVKANFDHDATACWNQHGQPGSVHKNSCEDYQKSNKLLKADTRSERREAGLDEHSRATTYLCQFCPYQSVVMQRYRKETGQYDA